MVTISSLKTTKGCFILNKPDLCAFIDLFKKIKVAAKKSPLPTIIVSYICTGRLTLSRARYDSEEHKTLIKFVRAQQW